MSNPMDHSKVIDQVKGVASGAAGLATGAMNVAAGAAKVIQQSAKSTMDGAKDMMKPSNDTIGNTKDTNKQQEQTDRHGSNSGGATQAPQDKTRAASFNNEERKGRKPKQCGLELRLKVRIEFPIWRTKQEEKERNAELLYR
jgi:hypothetical protein